MTFPSSQNWKVINDGETEPVGSFTLTESGELTHIVLPLLKVGTLAGPEDFRVSLFYDAGFLQPFASSDWVGIQGNIPLTGNWRGRVRFDFSGETIQSGVTYFAAVESQDYTRGVSYVSVGLNAPIVSTGFGGVSNGASLEVYIKKLVRI